MAKFFHYESEREGCELVINLEHIMWIQVEKDAPGAVIHFSDGKEESLPEDAWEKLKASPPLRELFFAGFGEQAE